MTDVQILKRLYKDYTKKHLKKIIFALLLSIAVAGSTSAIAYLLDPAIKEIFMKKDLWWLPPVFLANVTLNMPFVNRHSKEELEKNPDLRFKDYNNTIASCKRFSRQPTTIFSFAEGTRNTKKKH